MSSLRTFLRNVPAPAWIAAAAGIAGYAFRAAADDPHPFLVGIGVAGVAFAVTFAIRAVERAFND